MKDARVGWGVDGVKNANPSTESVSKMRTLKQKVGAEIEKAQPFVKKCVENAYPLLKKGSLRLTDRSQRLTFFRRVLEPLDLY